MLIRTQLVAATMVGFVLAPVVAKAATITVPLGPTGSLLSAFVTDPSGFEAPPITGSGALQPNQLFDSALGTLESVHIPFDGASLVRKTLDVEPGSYSVYGYVELELSHAPSGLNEVIQFALSIGGFNVSQSGPFQFSEGNSRRPSFLLTQDLGVFLSGGILELKMTGYLQISGPPGVLYDGPGDEMSTGWGSFGEMTYTYTPIPEPSTAVLVGLGLAALAAAPRRGA